MATNNSWQLLKFGGTSVSTRRNWDNIVSIIKRKQAKGKKVFVVHSAVSSVSNRLDALIDLALKNNYKDEFDELVEIHQKLLSELDLPHNLLDEEYGFLKRLLDGISLLGEVTERVRALVMSQGELWATKAGQLYLSKQFEETVLRLDARDYLFAHETPSIDYLCTSCEFERDEALLKAIKDSSIIITQGFIASTHDNETVLLGRGGSDSSASYFAAKIEAERLEIWTDVPGIFTANPNQVANARLLKQLNYEEAQEMASAGAKVLHPRAIRPAKISQIPIYIRSTVDPDIVGTVISSTENSWGMVKGVTAKEHITLVSMESQGMWQQAGFLSDIFTIFKQHNVSVDLVSTSETNITVSLDNLTQVVSQKRLAGLVKGLSAMCRVEVMHDCSAVSIVGKNVRAILHKIAPAFSIFETYKVYLLSQAASDLNLTFVIDQEHSSKVIASLHELLITNNPNSEILGPTAKELKQSNATSEPKKWWQAKHKIIENCLVERDSAYIYDLDSVRNNIQNLHTISSVDRVFFAVKSNNNPKVLKTAYEAGTGFETVSLGEVNHVLDLFPNIDKSRIFFTPNFADRKEYEKVLQKGIRLTLDSTYPLKHWPEIFADKEIFLRVDPNIGKGHHANVRTAGATSKFGIPMDELAGLIPIMISHNIKVVGLHAHAGSGILSNEHWAEHARLLAETASQFPDVKYLNLGGGFGIKERSQQSELTMSHIDESLQAVKEEYPQYQLWIEPGRYISANTGVLVSKVTQVKHKQNYYYVGLNTGMNSLMRPALYGSFHNIVNLSRLSAEKEHLATIVGPICESTDKLGVEIPFPETQEGDLILIENAGAYGRVMANEYNMRKPAEEVCIE